MDISTIVVISCVLTGVVMTIMGLGLAFVMRFGSQGLFMLFNRLTGSIGQSKQQEPAYESQSASAARSGISSGDALRQRARQVDFPAAPPVAQTGAAAFNAQAAAVPVAYQQPVQPSLRARDTLQYSGSTPAAGYGAQAQQPSSASLSPSRPFQGGAFPARPAAPAQQTSFQQPPMPPNNFAPQQPLSQPGLRQQPPMPPNNFVPQQPLQQGGFPPPPSNFQQPPPPPGTLGDYRPGLRSRPGSVEAGSAGSLRGANRDTRRNDDYEPIYDDEEGGIFPNLPL